MNVFRFDPAAHVYTLDDEEIPSVTTILRAGGLVDDAWWTEAHRERGRLVHWYCLQIDMGSFHGLDPVDEHLAPYIRAYQRFLARMRPKWTACEEPIVNIERRYAGTPDRLGYIGGRFGVLDVKTGVSLPWHAFQTAAYDLALGAPLGTRARWALYLRPDGSCKLRSHGNMADYAEFEKQRAEYLKAA